MNELHLYLCAMIVIFGVSITLSTNPVVSVIFLIMAFCTAAAQLILFHAEFLSLVFIIIYVGAIAVLFLFVVMMINIKEDTKFDSYFYFILNLLFYSILFLFLYSRRGVVVDGTGLIQLTIDPYYLLINTLNISLIDLYNIDLLGQVLFNNYLAIVLLAGLILLLALLGAVTLTAEFKKIEEASTAKQLARTEYSLSFFKRKQD
jgi:NADH-quinone oxidoreductase subunit J